MCASLMERDCKSNTIYRDLIGFQPYLTLIKLADFSFFLNFDVKITNISLITTILMSTILKYLWGLVLLILILLA